jgi:hypothetical protein
MEYITVGPTSHPYLLLGTVALFEPGSSVGMSTGYGLDGPGIESRRGRNFRHLSRPTQPPVKLVQGLSRG